MIPKDKEDLIYLTNKELLDIPKEKIEFVINHFWDTLRYYITHPLEAGRGIKVDTFLRFYIPAKRARKFKDKALARKNQPELYEEFYNQLLNNINGQEQEKQED